MRWLRDNLPEVLAIVGAVIFGVPIVVWSPAVGGLYAGAVLLVASYLAAVGRQPPT